MHFDRHDLLSAADHMLANAVLKHRGGLSHCAPDLVIAPDGNPYLYRWFLIPRNNLANVYFHIQVASDPERPLHDHPWDNTSVILSGGYNEVWDAAPDIKRHGGAITRALRAGNTVHRRATEAHRLILPPDILYTMTIFSTGPTLRPWGFWFPDGWRDAKEVTEIENGMSVMREEDRNG